LHSIHKETSKRKIQNPCREYGYSYCLIVVLIIFSIAVVSLTIIQLLIERILGAELWSALLSLSILLTIASRVIRSIKWSLNGFYVSVSMLVLSMISSTGLYMENISLRLAGALLFISIIILIITLILAWMIFIPHLLLRRYYTERSAGQCFPKRLSLKNYIFYFYTEVYVYLPQTIIYIFYFAVFLIALFYSLFTIFSRALPLTINEGLQKMNSTLSALNVLSIIVILSIISDTIHAYVRGSIGKEVGALDMLINDIKNKLKSFKDIAPDSINMAIYRFNEFIKRLELGDLEKGYVELTSALEAIRLWESFGRRPVIFNDNKNDNKSNDQECFTHSDIRGAIVHGSPKKKSTGIEERLNYFRTEPLVPILDLLRCLKNCFKSSNSIKEVNECIQRKSKHCKEVQNID